MLGKHTYYLVFIGKSECFAKFTETEYHDNINDASVSALVTLQGLENYTKCEIYGPNAVKRPGRVVKKIS